MPSLKPFRPKLLLIILLTLSLTLLWATEWKIIDVDGFSFPRYQRHDYHFHQRPPQSSELEQRPSSGHSDALYSQLSELPPFPSPPYPHSTLNHFAQIYVVTLKSRPQREQHMSHIADALGGLEFIFHPARDPFNNQSDKAVIERIGNWVLHEREMAWQDSSFDFSWSDEVGTSLPLDGALKGADQWIWGGDELPKEFKDRWVVDGEGRKPPQIAYGQNEFFPNQEWNAMDAPKIACWLSHYEIIRKIAEREDDGPVLILEDDVDFEFDIHNRLSTLFQSLPSHWDVLFLGHCFSDGMTGPSLKGSPYLRIPSQVMCTHAYAMTPTAARRLVRYLRSPLFAFSRPIDHIYNRAIIPGFAKYTVEPPVVVQVPKGSVQGLESSIGTDEVDGGNRQWLVDSVMERLEKLEKSRKS